MKQHRLNRENSILFVCDIQEKFVPKVYGREGVIEPSIMAIRSARILGIPILVTEHTKKVMGETCAELKKYLNEKEDHILTKTYLNNNVENSL